MYIIVITSVCSCGVDTHVYKEYSLENAKDILYIGYNGTYDEYSSEDRNEEVHDDCWKVWRKGKAFNEDNMTGKIYNITGVGEKGCDSWHNEF